MDQEALPMTIDERLEVITVNLSTQAVQDLLRGTAPQDGGNIRTQASVAEIHEPRISIQPRRRIRA
jgi:hypothetical protein